MLTAIARHKQTSRNAKDIQPRQWLTWLTHVNRKKTNRGGPGPRRRNLAGGRPAQN